MYNSKLILALLVSSFYIAPSIAHAVDGNNASAASGTSSEKPKKSVKELFKPSNKSEANPALQQMPEPLDLPAEAAIGEFGDDNAAPVTNPPALVAPQVNQMPDEGMNTIADQNKSELQNSESKLNRKPLPPETPPEELPELKGYKPFVPNSDEPKNENNIKAKDESFIEENMEGRSIMFNQISILRVMQVLSAYIESTSNKVPDKEQQERKKSLEEIQQELMARLKPEELVKTKKDIVTVKLPAYIKVDSILFRSNTNKQAWVNKAKFSEGDNNGEINIKAIAPEFVFIELSTKDTNLDLVKFKNLLKKAKKQQPITIDVASQTIAFKLGTNQYIDVQALKIKEGNFNLANANLDSKAGHYYDPMKPEDRFVPLEEAEKAAEEAGATYSRSNSSEENTEKPEGDFEAIDATEPVDGEVPVEGEAPSDSELPADEKTGEKEPLVQFKINKDDPNYAQMQQFAKEALASGKVSENDKAGYEAMANGEDTIPLD